MEVRPINCPNCGANIEVTHGEDTYTCKYCGSAVVVKREKPENGFGDGFANYTVVTYTTTTFGGVDGSPTIIYGGGTSTGKLSGVWLFIMNITMPGLGSILGGLKNNGIWQLALFWGGVALSWLVIGLVPMAIAYVWAFIDGLKLLNKDNAQSNENGRSST